MSYPTCYTDGMRRLKNPGKTQRVSLDLPEGLYERLRTMAFERKQSMNLILVECISQCFPAPEKTEPPAAAIYPEGGTKGDIIHEK